MIPHLVGGLNLSATIAGLVYVLNPCIGLVAQPIGGAQSNGVQGFFHGLANGIAREDLVLDTELENTLPFPSGLSSTDEVLVYVRGGGACVPVSRPGLTPLPLSRLFRRPAFSIASTSSCVNFSMTTSSTFSPPTTWKK